MIQVALAASVLMPHTAAPLLAYVGPGAGLGLFSALIGLVVAVFSALFFILAWPIRRLLRGRRAGTAEGEKQAPAGIDGDPRPPAAGGTGTPPAGGGSAG